MQLFTTRNNDKIHLPEIEATIEVLAIQGGVARLGVSAPDTVRVLRETPVDRTVWKPEVGEEASSMADIRRMLEKRLEIAREGLNEMRAKLQSGDEASAQLILEKVDEDLHLLRRRLRREFEKAESLSVGV
jgi:sRNA-binding carbon storage regulator CsrA